MQRGGKAMGKQKVKKKDKNKEEKKIIGILALVLVAILWVQIFRLYGQNQKYESKRNNLTKAVGAEEQRKDELGKMQEYTGSDAYIEEIARKKLGLIKGNEIIFKEETK